MRMAVALNFFKKINYFCAENGSFGTCSVQRVQARKVTINRVEHCFEIKHQTRTIRLWNGFFYYLQRNVAKQRKQNNKRQEAILLTIKKIIKMKKKNGIVKTKMFFSE